MKNTNASISDKTEKVDKKVISALSIACDLNPEDREDFFAMLATASIQYLRGSIGKEALKGFLSATSKDTSIMILKK